MNSASAKTENNIFFRQGSAGGGFSDFSGTDSFGSVSSGGSLTDQFNKDFVIHFFLQ